MRWLEMQRKPEPEVMSGEDEVSAYASAAAQKHLEALDNTFVDQVLSLMPRGNALTGFLLDVGCGPGNIALKLARRSRGLTIVGLDRSRNMVRAACRAAAEAGVEGRAFFQQAVNLSFVDKISSICFIHGFSGLTVQVGRYIPSFVITECKCKLKCFTFAGRMIFFIYRKFASKRKAEGKGDKALFNIPCTWAISTP